MKIYLLCRMDLNTDSGHSTLVVLEWYFELAQAKEAAPEGTIIVEAFLQ